MLQEVYVGPVPIRLELCNHELDIFDLKIGTLVTPALGNVHANLGFSIPYCR